MYVRPPVTTKSTQDIRKNANIKTCKGTEQEMCQTATRKCYKTTYKYIKLNNENANKTEEMIIEFVRIS